MDEGTLTTPSYVEKLTTALQEKLPGAQVAHELIRRERYRFFVIWNKFDEMDHPERQQLVWDLADSILTNDELWKISMILTFGAEDVPADSQE